MSENLQNIPVLLLVYWSESSVSKKERNGRTEIVEMCSRKLAKREMEVRENDEIIKEELGITCISTKIR